MVGMNTAASSYAESFVLTIDRLQNDLSRILGPNYTTYYGNPWEGGILGLSPGYKNILEEKLRYWQDIYLGVKITNDPAVGAGIKRVQINNELSCEAAYRDRRWPFAPKFIAFMSEYTSFLTAPLVLHDLIIVTTEASSGMFTDDQFSYKQQSRIAPTISYTTSTGSFSDNSRAAFPTFTHPSSHG
ncbi:hypothetical protein CIB48_g5237 [Xylaria polymorpha]|nr:hypothetical protein CIB48_g5237 [Xylaria polymorpha]